MAFVEAARFFDRAETYIACGALTAAGFDAHVRDNIYATAVFGTTIATGGYGVLVPEADVAAARELLQPGLQGNPEALAWREHSAFLSGMPLAVTAALTVDMGGVLIAGARAKPSMLNVAAAVIVIGMFVGLLALIFLGVFDQGHLGF